VRKRIDPDTGLLAWEGQENAIEEIFLAGTEPIDVASPDAGTDGGDTPETPAAADAGAGDQGLDAGSLLPSAESEDAGLPPLPAPLIPVKSHDSP
jgi:penicillin-binding protein 1A